MFVNVTVRGAQPVVISGVNVGRISAPIWIVIEAVVAHIPALGVNVYVVEPIAEVDIAAFHVPVIPLFEVVGNVPAVAF